MSRGQIIERERRWATPVAVAAALPFALYLLALFIESESGLELQGLLTEELRSIDANSGILLGASLLRALGFLAIAVPLVYLFRAAQARSERMQGMFLGFAVIGPVLLAVQSIVTWAVQTDVAKDFVAGEDGMGDVYTYAENLLEDSGAQAASSGLFLAGMLALIFAMIYTPLWASRTGLVTRFFGTLGMALGASLLFLPGVALLAILFWLAYLGLVVIGRAPGGRPPAWDAGEAVPWPRPGEEPVAAAGPADVIEGDASEIPGVGESPHAARRERAKRRKRKRRG